MTSGALFRATLPVVLCVALLTSTAANAQSRAERGVYDRLATLGITPDQVSNLRIYPRRDGNDRVQGSTAWMQVEQCPVGWVVMSLGRLGNVRTAYSRDGCELPGLD
jgi:hypothetical protein